MSSTALNSRRSIEGRQEGAAFTAPSGLILHLGVRNARAVVGGPVGKYFGDYTRVMPALAHNLGKALRHRTESVRVGLAVFVRTL
jgi:hypothetical protein